MKTLKTQISDIKIRLKKHVINQKQAFLRLSDLKQVETSLNNLIGTHQDCLATGSVIAAYIFILVGNAWLLPNMDKLTHPALDFRPLVQRCQVG